MALPTAPIPYGLPLIELSPAKLAEFGEELDRQLEEFERRFPAARNRRRRGVFPSIFDRRRPNKPR